MAGNQYDFPTEVLALPSKGLLYPEDSPLASGNIEIKYMTAKHEDILTSPTLLKKGIAIERLIQDLIVDKNIKLDELLVGDKNALLVGARLTGYGPEYEANVTCVACGSTQKHKFDLTKLDHVYPEEEQLKKYNIEFVSANPTGPLHVGHCRGAVFGDVISNLLLFTGNKVTKEFYVNDYGNQINIFSESVFYRLREIKFNEKFPFDKKLYPGNYIIDIAKEILKKNSNLSLNYYS